MARSTESSGGARGPGWFDRHPLIRVFLYYLGLGLVLLAIREWVPALWQIVGGSELPSSNGGLSVLTGQPAPAADPITTTGLPVGVVVTVAMLATVLLMLPVIWVYALTRQKKGYRQSMVQTLMILPIVVAAVVILVKNSVALAFSLGGIVGAIAFRNRLEDTKDAVYIFLAIVVGLACGVEVVPVALALSLFFNLVIVALWYTDFGRVPGELTAALGARRVETVREVVGEAGRASGGLVEVLEEQVLRSMTPEQLHALVQRAEARKDKMTGDLYGVDTRFAGPLRVTAAANANPGDLRQAVELVLGRETKEWRFERTTMGPAGQPVLEWHIRTRRSMPPALLAEAVRRAAIPHAHDVAIG